MELASPIFIAVTNANEIPEVGELLCLGQGLHGLK